MSRDPLNEALEHQVESLRHGFEVNRRDLFKLLGAGLVVGFCATQSWPQESGRAQEESTPQGLDSWLHVSDEGRVTVFTGKVEMGQNIRTSLAQQVAEELRVPLQSITLIMGDTRLTPFDLGTFGSRTTPQMGMQLRRAAATARELLLDLAAQQLSVPRAQLSIANGAVTDPATKKTMGIGDLTKGGRLVKPVSQDAPLTPTAQWRIAGTPALKVNGRAIVTGSHQYTSDLVRPGMLHGRVLRPDAFDAKLSSFDPGGADKLPSVTVVHDGDFVGVAAADRESAARALGLMKARWTAPPQISEADLFTYLKANPEGAGGGGFGGRGARESGDVAGAMAKSAKTLSGTYTVAYIQHAPLEPRAAVAEWNGSDLTVWTGTQRPFAVREELAAAFHVPVQQVRVLVPDTGSAYGGKHTGECAVEAARLARAAGKPVKLVWTREEEFTWAYFRPSGVIEVKSGAGEDGRLVAWEFHNYNSGPAAIETPYDVPNRKIEFHPTKYPLRQGSYRGLAATANHFARESHMDEMAHALKMDPLQFRFKNMKDERLKAAFETAARRFGWGRQEPAPERGFGIAGGFEKGGYVATAAEVAIDRNSGNVRIVRVVEAWDSGAVINPQGLENQIMGAIMQGIGGAIFEAIHFENGRILNPHFREYRVPRFRDMPKIEVELIDRKDQPSFGAGETPLLGLAPAVANAIFSATGLRLRSLPLMSKPLQFAG